MLYCYWIGKIGVGEKEREVQKRQRERQTDRALRVRICGKTIEEKKKFPNFVVLGII